MCRIEMLGSTWMNVRRLLTDEMDARFKGVIFFAFLFLTATITESIQLTGDPSSVV